MIPKFGYDHMNMSYRNALLKNMLNPSSQHAEYTKYDQSSALLREGSKHTHRKKLVYEDCLKNHEDF